MRRMVYSISLIRTIVPVADMKLSYRFHNPWYTTWGGFKTEDCTRQAMEPLFKQYGVDFAYNGACSAATPGRGGHSWS